MFSDEALKLLEDETIFNKIRKVVSRYVLDHHCSPSINSLISMAEFMSKNPCICSSDWKVFITTDKLFQIDLSLGVNTYINLVFHRDGLIEYNIKMPDDVLDEIFVCVGKVNVESLNKLLEFSKIYDFIDSGNLKDREISNV